MPRFRKRTAAALAARLNGQLIGEGHREVHRPMSLHDAKPDALSYAIDQRYAQALSQTKAGVVILGPGMHPPSRATGIATKHPHAAFARAVAWLLVEPPPPPGIDATASVHPSAQLAPSVSVAAQAFVDADVHIGAGSVLMTGVRVQRGVRIGEDTVLHPGVVVYPEVRIGSRVLVHANTVLGSDGFGFAFDAERAVKVPQVGSLIIEDDVEIGSNCAIDRGGLENTVIGAGSKLDNLVHMGHGCRIGQGVMIAGQVGFSGGVRIEDGVMMGGQVALAGHLQVGAKSVLMGKTGVTKSLEGGQHYGGFPARPVREWRRQEALLRRLPDQLTALLRRVDDLEAQLHDREPKADSN